MKRLQDYFAQAATLRRTVSQEELQAFVEAHAAPSGKGRTRPWTKGILFLAVAGAVVAGALMIASGGITFFNHKEEKVADKRESSDRPMIVEGHDCPLSEFVGGENGGKSNVAPASLAVLPMLELTPPELARLGIRKNSGDGIIFYSSGRGNDFVERDELRAGESGFPEVEISGKAPAGVHPLPFYPRLVTDDLGRLRRFYYTYDEIDSRLQDSIVAVQKRYRHLSDAGKAGEALDSMNAHPRFGKWFRELHERSRSLIDFNALLPVLIRSERPYTRSDSLAGNCRPDVIFWFDPTPELLSLLPSDWRRRIAPASIGSANATLLSSAKTFSSHSSENVPNNLQKEVEPIEDGTLQPATGPDFEGEEERKKRTEKIEVPAQPAQRDQSMRPGPGGPGLRPHPGAIGGAALLPNPVVQGTGTLRLQLHEPRTVAVSLHGIAGNRLTVLLPDRQLATGEHDVQILFQGIPSGIYLLAVSTDRGELTIRRVILK